MDEKEDGEIFSGVRGCKDGRYVELKNLPPSCADCLKIWEPHRSGNVKACTGIASLFSIYNAYRQIVGRTFATFIFCVCLKC
jgi:hypothetical protein